jgi:hypothetical protein
MYEQVLERLLMRFQHFLEDLSLDGHHRTIIEYWWNAIAEFSRRKLTSPTDRLPALAGFAARIQRSELGEYYAGLWAGDLLTSLLWYPLGIKDRASVPGVYIGPTWSWVSVLRQISWPTLYDKTFAKVTHIRSYQKTKSAFGEITAAWIRIEGRTRKGTFKQKGSGSSSWIALSSLKNVRLAVYLDQHAVPMSHLGEVLLIIIARTRYGSWSSSPKLQLLSELIS